MIEFQNPSMDLPKDRPMPKDRMTPYTIAPHTQTTDVKKPNYLEVGDLIELLSSHKENPEKWTFEYIASRFEISKENAGKIWTAASNKRINLFSTCLLIILLFQQISIEKLVANYSTLETYYAKAPSKSDKYLFHNEPVNRIRPNSTVFEAEDILTKGRTEKKWKSIAQVRNEFNNFEK